MDMQQWYKDLPFFTRQYMTSVFIQTFLFSFGLLSINYVYLDWYNTFTRLQLWRMFTNYLFFGKFSFDFLFRMLLLYFGLAKLEKLYAPNKYAEFFFLVIFLILFLTITGLIFGEYFMASALSFAFLYIWCKKVPFEQVQFLFGFIVSSGYLPWAILGYSVITGGSITNELMGLAAGHTYILLKDIVPQSHGYNLLRTPLFFEKLVNRFFYGRMNVQVGANINQLNQPQQQQQAFQGFRPFGGAGVRLN